MSNTEYHQKQLSQLKWEEKYIKSIIELHEDQLSRLKVEELALKHKISVEEGGHNENQDSTSQLNKRREQQMMETEDINAVPLMLETNHPYNDNEEDEDDDDDDDDENERDNKNYDSLKCFLDQLSQREQNKH